MIDGTLDLTVPATSDLKIDTDGIEVIGVRGQTSLTSPAGPITITQSSLTGRSTLDNNGGMVDVALPAVSSLHLDVTGNIETFTTDFPGISTPNSDFGGGEIHTNVGTHPSATVTMDLNGGPVVLHKQ